MHSLQLPLKQKDAHWTAFQVRGKKKVLGASTGAPKSGGQYE
jgi:hypothetical protein